MNQNHIYYPCFALFILTVIVLLRMFWARVVAIKTGTVDFRYFKTYNSNGAQLPMKMEQAARNFSNLMEVPILFYMVCGFALITQNVDSVFMNFAWAYVGFRYIHSFVHLTTNKILPRMCAYFLSWVCLAVMAVLLFLRIN